jgi:hypothetical protein
MVPRLPWFLHVLAARVRPPGSIGWRSRVIVVDDYARQIQALRVQQEQRPLRPLDDVRDFLRS